MFTLGTNWLFERIIKANEDANRYVIKYADVALEKALAAKETEVTFLKAQVEDLRAQVKYEQERCAQLMDRLLVRDAKVMPVAGFATQAAEGLPTRPDALKAFFDSMNSVGEETDLGASPVKVQFAGGGEAVKDTRHDAPVPTH